MLYLNRSSSLTQVSLPMKNSFRSFINTTAFFTSSATFLFLMQTAHAATITLIKDSNSPTIYQVTADNKRHAFPTLSVYQSWYGNDFSGVVKSNSTLDSWKLGGNVIYKQGTLIKIQTDPKVYLVKDEIGNLEWIPTEADFKNRGFSFKDVHDVSDAFFPDYHLQQNSSNFATPQITTSTIQGPIIPPQNTLVTEKKAPAISDILADSKLTPTGAIAQVSFTLTNADTVIFSYAGGGAATSSISLVPTTNNRYTKSFPVLGGGYSYNYHIEASSSDGQQISRDGSLLSYSDIVIQSLQNNLLPNKSLALPIVTVGEMRITNKSPGTIYFNQFGFLFETISNITNSVSKTLQLVNLKSDGNLGDVIAEKTVASTVSIINSTNIQKFVVAENLLAGETRDYAIVIKNLDQINIDAANTGDTFVTRLQQVLTNSDSASIAFPADPLGSLLYTRK